MTDSAKKFATHASSSKSSMSCPALVPWMTTLCVFAAVIPGRPLDKLSRGCSRQKRLRSLSAECVIVLPLQNADTFRSYSGSGSYSGWYSAVGYDYSQPEPEAPWNKRKPWINPVLSKDKSSIKCKHFMRGSCWHGEHCKYWHPNAASW